MALIHAAGFSVPFHVREDREAVLETLIQAERAEIPFAEFEHGIDEDRKVCVKTEWVAAVEDNPRGYRVERTMGQGRA